MIRWSECLPRGLDSATNEQVMGSCCTIRTRLSLGRLGLMALLCAFLYGCPTLAWSADFVEEPAYFRVMIEGRTVRLQGMTVKRPDAAEKLPVALITHGKPPNQTGMLDLQPTHLVALARDLARRG